jgi:hypothetical protein
MNTQTKIAGSFLNKMLTVGAGAAIATPAAAIIGHKLGYQSGARKASNEMATQFDIANQEENSQIANEFFNRGVRAASEIPKEAMECYYEGFNDELEKIGAGVPKWMKEMMPSLKKALTTGYKAIKGAPGQAIKGTKESFKAMYGKGPGSITQAIQGKSSLNKAFKSLKGEKITSQSHPALWHAGAEAPSVIKAVVKSLPAIAIQGAAATGAVYGGAKGVKALTGHKKEAGIKEAGAKEIYQAVKGAVKGVAKAGYKGTKESFGAAYGKGPGSIRASRIMANPNLFDTKTKKVFDKTKLLAAAKKAAPAVGLTLAGGGAAAYGGVKGVQALTGHKKTAELNQTNNPQIPTGTGAERRY